MINRALPFLLALGFVLSAAPAEAELGRLVDRARDAAERTVDEATSGATERAAENATDGAANAAHPHRAEIEAAAEALHDLWDAHDDDFALGSSADFDYSRVDQNNWVGESHLVRLDKLPSQ